MTSSRVANELAAMLVPLGIAGAVVAVLCAVLAGIAIMRGAGGLSGGAVGVWIPAAMLSSTASFANQWMPVIVSTAALVVMLVLGAVGRGVLAATAPQREAARAERASAAPATVSAEPATGTVSVGTGSIPTLARSNSARAA